MVYDTSDSRGRMLLHQVSDSREQICLSWALLRVLAQMALVFDWDCTVVGVYEVWGVKKWIQQKKKSRGYV